MTFYQEKLESILKDLKKPLGEQRPISKERHVVDKLNMVIILKSTETRDKDKTNIALAKKFKVSPTCIQKWKDKFKSKALSEFLRNQTGKVPRKKTVLTPRTIRLIERYCEILPEKGTSRFVIRQKVVKVQKVRKLNTSVAHRIVQKTILGNAENVSNKISYSTVYRYRKVIDENIKERMRKKAKTLENRVNNKRLSDETEEVIRQKDEETQRLFREAKNGKVLMEQYKNHK